MENLESGAPCTGWVEKVAGTQQLFIALREPLGFSSCKQVAGGGETTGKGQEVPHPIPL